jgi:hypothetical protein
MNESENDEFNVVAPDEWDRTELTVGSIVNQDSFQDWLGFDYWMDGDKEYIIKSIEGINVKLADPISGKFMDSWNIQDVNKDLKPNFKISDTMNESDEDEWSVEAPRDWDYQYLSLGDTITPEMWDLNNPELEDYIDDPTEDWKILELYASRVGSDASIFIQSPTGGELGTEMEEINKLLKPGYKIVVNKLNEVDEDEFNVDAPKEWSILEIGDIISPYMFRDDLKLKTSWKTLKEKPYKISGFGKDFSGPYVELIGEKFEINIDWNKMNNDLLKPEYQIVKPDFYMIENEDEFDVIAPDDWNKEYLTAGDIITPSMIKPKLPIDYRFYKNNTKIVKVMPQRHGDGILINTVFVDQDGRDLPFTDDFHWIEEWNQQLIEPYTISPERNFGNNLNELLNDEDEFNVVAPDDWNEEHLTVGSIITPNMIEPKAQIDTYNENVPKILKLMKKYPTEIKDISITYNWISLKLPQWSKLSFTLYLSDIQSILKHGYEFDEPSSIYDLYESDEDEFDVVAPDDFNVTELGVGDMIEPFMIEPKAKIISWLDNDHKILRIMKKYPSEIRNISDDMKYIFLKLPQWSQLPFVMKLSDIQSILKPGYEISKPSTLDEVDEDEFDVEAPKEWDIKVLTTGDILTNEHLGTGGNTAYKIIGFEDNRVKIEKGKISKRKTGDIFTPDNMYSTTNILISILQRKLNPGYVIEPPTTIKLSELLKVDDE